MKKKLSLVTFMALSGLFSINSLYANEVEVSGNIGISSNYIWRGITQTKDNSQTSGGVDLAYDKFYLGTWASNVDFGDDTNYELDVYGGYSDTIKDFTYDISYISYMYPSSTAPLDLQEIVLSLGYNIGALSLGTSYNYVTSLEDKSAEKLNYTEITASYDFGVLSLNTSYGDYEKTGTNYLIGVSKSYDLSDATLDLNLAYTNFSHDTDSTKDEENVFASVTYNF